MELEEKFPDNARGVAKFNVPLAHMMMAGADYIIIPSRFEPCGLIQFQGMRYGAVICLTLLPLLLRYLVILNIQDKFIVSS